MRTDDDGIAAVSELTALRRRGTSRGGVTMTTYDRADPERADEPDIELVEATALLSLPIDCQHGEPWGDCDECEATLRRFRLRREAKMEEQK